MKIYIASRFADRMRLRPIRDRLFSLGHECTNTWLDEGDRSVHLTHDEFFKKLAIKDLTEIAGADLLIRDVHEVSSTGGADTEYGFALAQAQRKMVWLVGKPRNVFHTLADRIFDSWDACFSHLEGNYGSRLRDA